MNTITLSTAASRFAFPSPKLRATFCLTAGTTSMAPAPAPPFPLLPLLPAPVAVAVAGAAAGAFF